MARFKKSNKEGTPGLNTGSMSDIVFMFLFFFMVITNMRESSLYVKIKVPQASEVQKLEKKSLVSYINVGVPMDERKYGHEPRIQLNDQISEVSDIASLRSSFALTADTEIAIKKINNNDNNKFKQRAKYNAHDFNYNPLFYVGIYHVFK